MSQFNLFFFLLQYVGESERAVRQVFQRAKNSSPCVIFFDELDALCPRRSSSGGSGDSSARVVNQLLTEMDGMESRKGVFVMGATNRVDIIDPAVLRPGRLQKILYVDLPTAEERVDILKAITRNGTKPVLDSDVNFNSIASDMRCDAFSGADMSALVSEASAVAFKSYLRSGCTGQPKVSAKHFQDAFDKVKPSVSAKDRHRYELMKGERNLKTYPASLSRDGVVTPILPTDESIKETEDKVRPRGGIEKTGDSSTSTAAETTAKNEGKQLNEKGPKSDSIPPTDEPVKEKEDNLHPVGALEKNRTPSTVEKEAKRKQLNEKGPKSDANGHDTRSEESDTDLDKCKNSKTHPRFLLDMEVRVKDSAPDKSQAGQEGCLTRIVNEDMSCLLKLNDGREIRVNQENLEPFIPDINEPCKLLTSHDTEEIATMKEYLENDEDNVIVEFKSGKVHKISIDQLCKVSLK